ncbi:MAG: hypothetical protein KGP01_05505 [Actinomycetales bacterium]|nr:hypothetical protein [Actinomycetales bacterium]
MERSFPQIDTLKCDAAMPPQHSVQRHFVSFVKRVFSLNRDAPDPSFRGIKRETLQAPATRLPDATIARARCDYCRIRKRGESGQQCLSTAISFRLEMNTLLAGQKQMLHFPPRFCHSGRVDDYPDHEVAIALALVDVHVPAQRVRPPSAGEHRG